MTSADIVAVLREMASHSYWVFSTDKEFISGDMRYEARHSADALRRAAKRLTRLGDFERQYHETFSDFVCPEHGGNSFFCVYAALGGKYPAVPMNAGKGE